MAVIGARVPGGGATPTAAVVSEPAGSVPQPHSSLVVRCAPSRAPCSRRPTLHLPEAWPPHSPPCRGSPPYSVRVAGTGGRPHSCGTASARARTVRRGLPRRAGKKASLADQIVRSAIGKMEAGARRKRSRVDCNLEQPSRRRCCRFFLQRVVLEPFKYIYAGRHTGGESMYSGSD